MFEKQVSAILEQVLGTYFEDFDTQSLNVSVFGGKVVLDDLRLRPTALAALKLPLTVRHGHVRRVELELSLSNLRGSPAKMLLDGIELVIAEDDSPGGGAGEHERDVQDAADAREQRLQQDRHDRRQALLSTPKQLEGGVQASMAARLATGFVNNLVIHMTNVHMRIMGPATASAAFTIGVRWEAFSITTTDASWRPATAHADAQELFKQAQMTKLSVYTTRHGTGGAEEASMVAPVDLQCRTHLLLSTRGLFDKPLMSVDLHIGTAKATLTDIAVRELTQLLDNFSLTNERCKHMAARPQFATNSTSYRGSYTIWWQYAMTQVLNTVRERQSAWHGNTLSAQATRLREYVPLFRRALGLLPLPALHSAEEARMRDLEGEMPDTMIMAIRHGVTNRIRIEARTALDLARKSQPKVSLFSRMFWRSKAHTHYETLLVGGYKVDLTPEERTVLEEVLESSAATLDNDHVQHDPVTWIKYTFSFTLRSAELELGYCLANSLFNQQAPQNGHFEPVLSAQIAGLRLSSRVRTTSNVFDLALQSVTVCVFVFVCVCVCVHVCVCARARARACARAHACALRVLFST